jgi:hypothetical protein
MPYEDDDFSDPFLSEDEEEEQSDPSGNEPLEPDLGEDDESEEE